MSVKTVGTLTLGLKTIGEPNAKAGEFEAILSAPTVDRDGEVILEGAFEPLPARIPIDIDHGLSVEKTVGSGVPFYEDGVLKLRGTFASTPLGQDTRTLVAEGHVGHMSVAFMGALVEDRDGVPTIVKAELLNAAITPIPSNREAAITAVKHLKEKVGARNSMKDAERLQLAHDLLMELGAKCGADEAETEETETESTDESTTDESAKSVKAPDGSTPANAGVAPPVSQTAADLALIEAEATLALL